MKKMKISEALLKGEEIALGNGIAVEPGHWFKKKVTVNPVTGLKTGICTVCAIGAVALACGATMAEADRVEYGLDKLGSLPTSPTGSSAVQGRDVCSLLTKEEVSEITGV